jgi:peroxiredoxin
VRKRIAVAAGSLLLTLSGLLTLQAAPLQVGDKAPDFTLKDTNWKDVKLSDFRGKNVVLAFYVLAFTGG